jgi:hypothetical protein
MEEKHAGGRPSEYKEEYCKTIEEYLRLCGREQTELPTVEGFAAFIGVDADTIGNWAYEKVKDKNGEETSEYLRPKFFGAIKILKDKQKNQLMNDGLYGGKDVNATMAIFLLKVNHGMVETSHTDITTAGEKFSVGLVSYQDQDEV